MAIIGISGKKQHGKDTVCRIIQYLFHQYNYHGKIVDTFDCWVKTFQNYHNNWERKLFADKLKDIVCMLIGCTREQLEDNKFKEKELGKEWWRWEYLGSEGIVLIPYEESTGTRECALIKMTPRKLLQLLGTECGRQIIHPNVWVNALMADYKKSITDCGEVREADYKTNVKCNLYPNWLITDVRFPNEAEAIKQRNGVIIRVNKKTDWVRTCLKCFTGFDNLSLDRCPVCNSLEHAAVKYIESDHESETALDNYNKFDAVIENNGTVDDLILKVKETLITLKLI